MKNCQLGKFLKIFCSSHKCLFEISTTHIEKVGNCKFWENLIELKIFFSIFERLKFNFLKKIKDIRRFLTIS